MCQSAAFVNNGNTYKCGVPNTGNRYRAELQSIPHLLNYNWGLYSDFVERVTTGGFGSACDSKIMHGKFSNGDNPSSIVFRNQTSGQLQALTVVEHVPFYDLPTMTTLFCGSTNPQQAVPSDVDVYTFDILDYYIFGYL